MTFEEIVRLPQHALKKALVTELNHMGYKTITKKGFTYAKGAVPVMLVAHLDTFHKQPVQTICYSDKGRIVMSPQGIGGDDRDGVYMILEIIKKHRCHVLFCEDEEVGGIGAHEFVKSKIKPEINYIVELDRRGTNDAVFYNCENHEFTDFVCGFGFEENIGSFSDISIIAPSLGIAAVNISAGYFNEHTLHEYVDMAAISKNIVRVGEMVSMSSPRFEYIEAVRFSRTGHFSNSYYGYRYDPLNEDYWQDLRFMASSFGYSKEAVDELRTLGYAPDEVEQFFYYGDLEDEECDFDDCLQNENWRIGYEIER